jgi:hypothetical protein
MLGGLDVGHIDDDIMLDGDLMLSWANLALMMMSWHLIDDET